jgi:hypothetical protein
LHDLDMAVATGGSQAGKPVAQLHVLRHALTPG